MGIFAGYPHGKGVRVNLKNPKLWDFLRKLTQILILF